MESLNSFASQWAGVLFLLLLAAVVGLLVAVVGLARRAKAQKQMWQDLLQGVDADNVEALLYNHLKARVQTEQEIQVLVERVAALESKMKTAKRYVGLVRYDAFQEVGGEQSFSLAVYDEEGNGAVLTSQVGRDSSRLFGKRLASGESDRGLTQEETLALEEAVGSRSRSRAKP